MTTALRPTSVTPHSPPQDPRLVAAVRQLQGVFVEQLFKAMRETVPQDGVVHGGQGESMFTGLMDQHLAEAVPGQWSSELGDALLARFRAADPVPAPVTR